MNRAASDRMLDVRAGYAGPVEKEDIALEERGVEGFRNSPAPTRSRAKVAAIYAHPHEMPNHDYFWGGWISAVTEQDQWVMSNPKRVPHAKALEEFPPFMAHKGPAPVELLPPR